MKLLYFTKTTLKGMVSTGAVTILYFVLFPVLLAGFMGFFQNTLHDNPLKLNDVKVQIIDNDNTNMSKALVDLLKSENMKELIKITDEKPVLEITIPKGYEESLISLQKNEIKINKLEDGFNNSTNTLKIILDKYHKNLYVSIAGGSNESLEEISQNTIVETININTSKTSSSYEVMAASMIGFAISMLIFSQIQASYTDISMKVDRRIISTPISKLQFFYYDTFISFIYSLIIIGAYIFFFRIAGISFTGLLIPLIVLLLASALMIVGISKSVLTFFGAKYGKLIGALIFTLPIIGMEAFTGEGNALKVLAPTHYISKLLNIYNLEGSISSNISDLSLVILIPTILLALATIKIVISRKIALSRGDKKCA